MPAVRAAKVIPTRWAGTLFRSRTEARWAVFFDALLLEWFYEPDGYELPSGPYLPDFWLPHVNGGCFVEVKGAYPTSAEQAKAAELAIATGRPVYTFFGPVALPDDRRTTDSAVAQFPDGSQDFHYLWCECGICGNLGIQFDGRSARLDCGCYETSDKEYNAASPLLRTAYDAARSQRFGT